MMRGPCDLRNLDSHRTLHLLADSGMLLTCRADYVNVICASGPYLSNCYDRSCGMSCEYFPGETKTLGCVPDVLFPATTSVVNDLSQRISDMQPVGSKVKSLTSDRCWL